jgi:hypothetical protein
MDTIKQSALKECILVFNWLMLKIIHLCMANVRHGLSLLSVHVLSAHAKMQLLMSKAKDIWSL